MFNAKHKELRTAIQRRNNIDRDARAAKIRNGEIKFPLVDEKLIANRFEPIMKNVYYRLTNSDLPEATTAFEEIQAGFMH